MRKIPPKLLEDMLADPYYKVCARARHFNDHECKGRITLEHALTYAGRQLSEKFAIIPLCAWAHDVDEFQDGGNLNKEKNQFIALMRATGKDFMKYPKNDWAVKMKYLKDKFIHSCKGF